LKVYLSRYILHICYSKEIPSEELVLKYCEMYIKKVFGFQVISKGKRFEI